MKKVPLLVSNYRLSTIFSCLDPNFCLAVISFIKLLRASSYYFCLYSASNSFFLTIFANAFLLLATQAQWLFSDFSKHLDAFFTFFWVYCLLITNLLDMEVHLSILNSRFILHFTSRLHQMAFYSAFFVQKNLCFFFLFLEQASISCFMEHWEIILWAARSLYVWRSCTIFDTDKPK